jgi:hypothetical protein
MNASFLYLKLSKIQSFIFVGEQKLASNYSNKEQRDQYMHIFL